MTNKKDRYVYIMLSQTSTIPSKLIRAYTKEEYAHSSLGLDINLENLYSFARKRVNNPIDCGFIYEDINSGIFGRDKDTLCRVYALQVTESQYDKIVQEIDIFKKNQPQYSYNYKGIFGVMVNVPISQKNKYFCSEFVTEVLLKAGIDLFGKNPSLACPADFMSKLQDRLIYEGLLCEYRQYMKEYNPDDIEKLIEANGIVGSLEAV